MVIALDRPGRDLLGLLELKKRLAIMDVELKVLDMQVGAQDMAVRRSAGSFGHRWNGSHLVGPGGGRAARAEGELPGRRWSI